MSTRPPTIVVIVLLSSEWLSNVAAREWTDSTGQYRVEAELIDFTDGVVRLRKEDGAEIAVPLEKLSLADQRFLEQKSAVGRSQRDGFLVETGDGLYYVDLNGNTEPFAKGKKVVGRPAVRGSRVFVLVDGAIREFNARGRLVRAMAITDVGRPQGMVGGAPAKTFQKSEKSRSRLVALPEKGFVLLSPGMDWVYFFDERGAWKRTVEILDNRNWPDLLGTVAGGGLLVSNIHMRDVRRVDLKTFKTEVYMRSDRSLGPIAFDPERAIYYVCSGGAIHAVSMKGKRGQPNVSQAPKICTVRARFIDTTIQPRFISGIVLDGDFAYVTLFSHGCMVRVNVTTGEAEGFVRGLTHPGVIVRLKE